jgi:hypothetical protein
VKILLDECVPWPLSRHLKSHQCTNPHRLGWAGLKNGDLLAEAETNFLKLLLIRIKACDISKTEKGGDWRFWSFERMIGG